MKQAVYLVVVARDDIDCAVPKSVGIKEMSQSKASYKQTRHKQSLLMLCKRARMPLEGKDCARSGFEVVIEEIHLSPLEPSAASDPHQASNILQLKYISEGLLVRAVNEQIGSC